MINIIKTTVYSAVALSSVAFTSVSAINYGRDKVSWNTNITDDSWKGISEVITDMLTYVFNFLYIIAFVLILWAGFKILTAAGDEESVKKGKTIMIQAAIGLVVIFLASQIVDLFFSISTSQDVNISTN